MNSEILFQNDCVRNFCGKGGSIIRTFAGRFCKTAYGLRRMMDFLIAFCLVILLRRRNLGRGGCVQHQIPISSLGLLVDAQILSGFQSGEDSGKTFVEGIFIFS